MRLMLIVVLASIAVSLSVWTNTAMRNAAAREERTVAMIKEGLSAETSLSEAREDLAAKGMVCDDRAIARAIAEIAAQAKAKAAAEEATTLANGW